MACVSLYAKVDAQASALLGGTIGHERGSQRIACRPVIPPLDDATGTLPRGRYLATEAEVRAAFVDDLRFATSTTRPCLWPDWSTGLALLRSVVTVHAVWLGGSFVTAALNPGDLDVVYLVSGQDYVARSIPEQQVVEGFNTPVRGPLGNWTRSHGLALDSYVLAWEPRLSTDVQTVGDATYVQSRGYWDDFWSRNRTTPKPMPVQGHDVLPTRGYVEVLVDDYA